MLLLLFGFAIQFPLQRHALVHLKIFLMQPQCPALHSPPLHPHLDFLHGLKYLNLKYRDTLVSIIWYYLQCTN